MYKISEFASLIGVSISTLRNWDKKGILKPIKLASSHRRYTEEQLLQILNQNNERCETSRDL